MMLMPENVVFTQGSTSAGVAGKIGRLVVASNRLPSVQPPSNEEEIKSMPVGGLVTAIQSALVKQGGLWFGWSGHITEGDSSGEINLSDAGPFQLAALDISQREARLFYSEFSNRTLWPLLHSFPAKMSIDRETYNVYLKTNQRYARTLIPLLSSSDTVWVHDYHLLPLGHELRRLGWTGKIGWFLHTPFPPAEVFTILPWAPQLLSMLLDYDLVGVHTRRYFNNLFDSLSWELPGVALGNSYIAGDKSLSAGVYPIGIDPADFRSTGEPDKADGSGAPIRKTPGHRIILGVDRLDYTKGIPQRLLIFERLLERYPQLRGKVSMIQISAPSRKDVPEYEEERHHVDLLVGRINGRFSDPNWIPIRYLYRAFSQKELLSFYQIADVCMVTPLRDGMNLVAKEYVAAQGEDPGVVVLSKFCGAAYSMRDALIVNPYDLDSTAEAVHLALRMSKEERLSRWQALMKDIETNTAQTWSNSFLSDLTLT